MKKHAKIFLTTFILNHHKTNSIFIRLGDSLPSCGQACRYACNHEKWEHTFQFYVGLSWGGATVHMRVGTCLCSSAQWVQAAVLDSNNLASSSNSPTSQLLSWTPCITELNLSLLIQKMRMKVSTSQGHCEDYMKCFKEKSLGRVTGTWQMFKKY